MAPGVKLSTVKINKSTSLSESMVDGDGDEIIIMRLIMCTMHYECTGTDPIRNVCSLHCFDTMSSFEKLVSYVDAVPLASTVLVEEHC